jgi:hypothetical protein
MQLRWIAPMLWAGAGALLGGASCGKDEELEDAASGGWCEAAPAGHPQNAERGCDARCPGDPGWPPSDDVTLHAGAAVRDISPKVEHVAAFAKGHQPGDAFNPLAGDKCVKKSDCDLADPLSCDDAGAMSCWWIAGFGMGRPADGVADPVSVRCLVLRQGETKLGLCIVDAVGWFFNEVERTRQLVAEKYAELELDWFTVGATHVHEAQDTMGIWGPVDGESGVKRDYNTFIREQTAEALKAANDALEPVKVEYGATRVDGHITETDPLGKKTAAYVSDTRDPVVIDDELRTMRFVASDGGDTVATLINFTSHPEFGGDVQQMISADYPGMLRKSVEEGLEITGAGGDVLYERPGVGGVAIFVNGALGGQVGPGAVVHTDFDGNPLPDGLERAYVVGKKLAAYALEAMSEGHETLETAPIGVRARGIHLAVDNTGYHIAIAQGLFDRDGMFYDPTLPLGEDNLPAIQSEISVIDIGPAELVSLPGELHAELLLATRDGKTALDAPYPFTPEPFHVLNDPATNPDCGTDGTSRCDDGPPDIGAMDRSIVIDLHRDPGAKYRWVLGLTPDEYGYVVPAYDYELHPENPYLDEASPGNHYEETNSVGPRVQAETVEPILQLLASPPVVRRGAE